MELNIDQFNVRFLDNSHAVQITRRDEGKFSTHNISYHRIPELIDFLRRGNMGRYKYDVPETTKPVALPRYLCIYAHTPEALTQELNAQSEYKPAGGVLFFDAKFYLLLELRRP